MIPLLVVLAVHANKLPGRLAAAGDFNAAGRQQIGPPTRTTSPCTTP